MGQALLKSDIAAGLGLGSFFARKLAMSGVSVGIPSYPDSFSHAGSTGGRW